MLIIIIDSLEQLKQTCEVFSQWNDANLGNYMCEVWIHQDEENS